MLRPYPEVLAPAEHRPAARPCWVEGQWRTDADDRARSGKPGDRCDLTGINGCGTTITTDQRGVSRPQGSGCDIGAFEVAPTVDVSITKSGSPNPVVRTARQPSAQS